MTAHNHERESYTAQLFPRIHTNTTRQELQRYRARIGWLLKRYTSHTHIPIRDDLKDKDILEVGCGGRASGIYALSPYEPRSMTAVDLSPQNVATTAQISQELRLNNVRVEVGNALDLPFPEDSFDFVFSNGVIHHTVDPYRCFEEMCRVLKANGHIFLGIYGYGGVWGKLVHPSIMLLGSVIPIEFMERVVNFTGFMKSQERSLLDLLYTPIQKTFRVSEIQEWFDNNNFVQTTSLGSPKRHYQLGMLTRILFGDGYIYMMGRKNTT